MTKNLIEQNFHKSINFREGSFVGRLYDDAFFDFGEYRQLEDGIYKLSKTQGNTINREIAFPLVRIFSFSMMLFASHLDKNDVYTIDNLSVDQLQELRERIQLVWEGFFEGKMPNRKILAGMKNA